jgi:hypothetical protein
VTTRRVVEKEAPILGAIHDANGAWEFLDCGGAITEENCATVLFGHLTALDPSLLSLSDLPRGWEAWRSTPDAPFVNGPMPVQDPTDP